MSICPCFTSVSIIFDQNLHHLHSSSSAGGKDLYSDTQITVIGSMEPKTCMKMLRNLSENMRAKLPSGTLSYSIVRIACLYDALSGFSSTGSKPCRRSVKKDKKRRKRNRGKKRKEKPWDKDHVGQFWFLPKQKCCTMWG